VLIVNLRPPDLAGELRRAVSHADEIWVVSAYVTPGACADVGLEEQAARKPVRVVVGRASEDGAYRPTLQYLMHLDSVASRAGGGVRAAAPPSHAKVYCFRRAGAAEAFVGSANLTEHGLSEWHECVLRIGDPLASAVISEATSLYSAGIPISRCPVIKLAAPPGRAFLSPLDPQDAVRAALGARPAAAPSLSQSVTISLLNRAGHVPSRSGLNWWNGRGRPRHEDEAYVHLPAEVVRSGAAALVFGDDAPGTLFTGVTHTGHQLDMMLQGSQPVGPGGRVAAKQITSAGDTHSFGTWILRTVLGVPTGSLVTDSHLHSYGRTDITFCRVGQDPATRRPVVFIDFSV
jgi:HKD family nuclease